MKIIRRTTPGGHTFYEVRDAKGLTVTTGSRSWITSLYPTLEVS